MDALRIILHQSSANYKREETVINKMTYPLPPFSTVIGALHNACRFKTYHPMDISIQGKYESMHKEMYTNHSFLNSLQDDRGIMVKMRNNHFLSKAFDKVAVAEKKQGNSFREGKTIQIHNGSLLQEYRDLKNLKDELDKFKEKRIKRVLALIKKRKSILTRKKNGLDKKSRDYTRLVKRESEIKQLEKRINAQVSAYENTHFQVPYSMFKTLTTSPMYYEILDQIELVIHIRSDEETLRIVQENIYNIKSLGRSEDFVDVIDAKLVSLSSEIDDEVKSQYSAYLDYDLVKNEVILLNEKSYGIPAGGTKYYLNKNYQIINYQRIFEKKKVIYASSYLVDELAENLFLDKTTNQTYIVNFI